MITTGHSHTGSQPASARMPQTIPMPMAAEEGEHPGRAIHPGPSSRRRARLRGGAGGACGVWSTTSVTREAP